MQKYVGRYTLNGLMGLNVYERAGQLIAELEGAPPDHEILLEPKGTNVFRMSGGPAHGGLATALADADKESNITAFQLAGLTFERDETASEMPGFNLLPAIELDDAKKEAFANLYATTLKQGAVPVADYNLPYPKHEFVRYLQQEQGVLFHGSNNLGLSELAPIRRSYENFDQTGRGNLQAVYATSNGIWAMFFATIDREKLSGMMNNGVLPFNKQDGQVTELYFFSLDATDLAKNPWRDGMLYVLPAASFEQNTTADGTPLPEWVSQQAVVPLLKLPVSQQDFPFISQVSLHQSAQVAELENLVTEIFAEASAVTEPENGLTVYFNWSVSLYEKLCKFIPLQRNVMPAMSVELLFEAAIIRLTLRESSPILINMLKRKLPKVAKN